MRARSITSDARSSIPQSHATATRPAAPSARGTSFHPVPLQSVQFSRAMPTAYGRTGRAASHLACGNLCVLGLVRMRGMYFGLVVFPGNLRPIPVRRCGAFHDGAELLCTSSQPSRFVPSFCSLVDLVLQLGAGLIAQGQIFVTRHVL